MKCLIACWAALVWAATTVLIFMSSGPVFLSSVAASYVFEYNRVRPRGFSLVAAPFGGSLWSLDSVLFILFVYQ